jgi:hypothetical protein
MPDDERQRAAKDLEGQRRYLAVAVNVGPFFGDATRLLVSDQPFEELDLLQTTGGDPIQPPRAERVLPPGTVLRIDKVEFPTGWLIAKRVVMTPRYHPWVYLQLEGERRPLVLVLPMTVANAEDVRLEVERLLATANPAPALAALAPFERAAVLRKELVDGMPAEAVQMAWGYPEKKIVDRPAGTEEWIWAGGKRKAFLADGKLTRSEASGLR